MTLAEYKIQYISEKLDALLESDYISDRYYQRMFQYLSYLTMHQNVDLNLLQDKTKFIDIIQEIKELEILNSENNHLKTRSHSRLKGVTEVIEASTKESDEIFLRNLYPFNKWLHKATENLPDKEKLPGEWVKIDDKNAFSKLCARGRIIDVHQTNPFHYKINLKADELNVAPLVLNTSMYEKSKDLRSNFKAYFDEMKNSKDIKKLYPKKEQNSKARKDHDIKVAQLSSKLKESVAKLLLIEYLPAFTHVFEKMHHVDALNKSTKP
ncbi:MAG: hypothetical protein CMF41_01830 [Legionellales bacterium]|nr:hypothetical protein [Legionellales bacterium]OUX65892.1 MAG: hypothetical protein CBE41_01025 [Gammaproteobacteria bacterium TMED281]